MDDPIRQQGAALDDGLVGVRADQEGRFARREKSGDFFDLGPGEGNGGETGRLGRIEAAQSGDDRVPCRAVSDFRRADGKKGHGLSFRPAGLPAPDRQKR